MATTLWAPIARWTVFTRAVAAGLCFDALPVAAGRDGWVAAPLWLELCDGLLAVEVVAPPEAAVVDVPPEVPSLPEAALLAFEVATAWWALLMADWYWPRPCGLELPPLEDPLGLSATSHSAKNATVPTSKAINERDAGIARLIIGTASGRHEHTSEL